MNDHEAGDTHYIFRVRFRPAPAPPDVDVDPETFETTPSRRAAPPGEAGWLFFRDNLWRGAVGDEPYLREITEEALGVPVESIAFSELRTDQPYLDALRAAIREELGAFRADSVEAALSKYLGSSIRVTRED